MMTVASFLLAGIALLLPLTGVSQGAGLKELLVDMAFEMELSGFSVSQQDQASASHLALEADNGMITFVTYRDVAKAGKAFRAAAKSATVFHGYSAIEMAATESMPVSTFAWIADKHVISIARTDGAAREWAETVCSNMLANGSMEPPPMSTGTTISHSDEKTPEGGQIVASKGSATIDDPVIKENGLLIGVSCADIDTGSVVLGTLSDLQTGRKLMTAPKLMPPGGKIVFRFKQPLAGWTEEDMLFDVLLDGVKVSGRTISIKDPAE